VHKRVAVGTAVVDAADSGTAHAVCWELTMKPILIAYATREGHARRIAERISELLARRRVLSALYDAASLETAGLYLEDYAAAIILASVHNRSHEPEAVRFAKRYRRELNARPCLVLSLSSAQILAESARAPKWLGRLAAGGARELLKRFLAETGLRTTLAYPLAGALAFTKYARSERWAFALFARLGRVHIDTTRNCEYTDMVKVERHVEAMLAALTSQSASSVTR
jgi:menaquinone-dependent protoporphyrinogen oxidase